MSMEIFDALLDSPIFQAMKHLNFYPYFLQYLKISPEISVLLLHLTYTHEKMSFLR